MKLLFRRLVEWGVALAVLYAVLWIKGRTMASDEVADGVIAGIFGMGAMAIVQTLFDARATCRRT